MFTLTDRSLHNPVCDLRVKLFDIIRTDSVIWFTTYNFLVSNSRESLYPVEKAIFAEIVLKTTKAKKN